jgi:hypothetical protein
MTNAATLAAVAASGFRRNRIQNGNFTVDQRYSGQGTALVLNGSWVGDRWGASKGGAHVGDIGLRYPTPAGGPHPTGMVYSITTGAAPAATDFNAFYHQIEGTDMADLHWGFADAKPATLSFSIYTPLAGVYTVRVVNPAFNRSYVAAYTVAAASTWQRVIVTIPGDTTGAWPITSADKWRVDWDMGSGTNYNAAAANVWGAGNLARIAGSVNFAAAARQCFITAVQLEAGSIATPFEWRNIRDQLSDCQRWYQVVPVVDDFYATIAGQIKRSSWLLPVVMRANNPFVTIRATSNLANTTVNSINANASVFYHDIANSAGGPANCGASRTYNLDCEGV